jgi:hypothetical protein
MATGTTVTDSRVTYGSALVFEDIPAGSAPLRVRPLEDSLLRVVAGLIRLTTDDSESLLGPGAEAIVPAGSCYRLASVSGTSRTLTGFRSPLPGRDDRIS